MTTPKLLLTALLIFFGTLVFSRSPVFADSTAAASPAPQPQIADQYKAAFQLGRLMQQPIVSVLFLDTRLTQLESYPDDASASKAILDDGKIAATTRSSEAESYRQASHLIGLIHGPDSTHRACDYAVATLTKTVVMTGVSAQNPSDPITLQILATLDEADMIRPDPSPLVAWLKLTSGKEAVWAFHLGQFSVGLASAIDLNQLALYQPELIPGVVRNVPVDAPTTIVSSIATLKAIGPSDPTLPAAIQATRKAIDAAFAVPRVDDLKP